LLDYHHAPHRKATSGKPGQGGHRNGADGKSLTLSVPNGTVVKTPAGEVLADLENQLVDAWPERLALEQRRAHPPVRVGPQVVGDVVAWLRASYRLPWLCGGGCTAAFGVTRC